MDAWIKTDIFYFEYTKTSRVLSIFLRLFFVVVLFSQIKIIIVSIQGVLVIFALMIQDCHQSTECIESNGYCSYFFHIVSVKHLSLKTLRFDFSTPLKFDLIFS